MKLIESVGLSRSGHHAILNWVLHNLVGFQIEWKFKMTLLNGTDVFLLDEANHDIPTSFKFIDEFLPKIGTLIVSYEDTSWDYTIFREDRNYYGPLSLNFKKEYDINYVNRFFVIRDFYDNLVSRTVANNKVMGVEYGTNTPFYFKTDEIYIERWKNLAKACVEKKIPYIKFEDWQDNQNKRTEFLYNTFGINEINKPDKVIGTKSSFGSDKKAKRFYDLDVLSDEIKNCIMKDNELHYLIGKLDYNYREL